MAPLRLNAGPRRDGGAGTARVPSRVSSGERLASKGLGLVTFGMSLVRILKGCGRCSSEQCRRSALPGGQGRQVSEPVIGNTFCGCSGSQHNCFKTCEIVERSFHAALCSRLVTFPVTVARMGQAGLPCPKWASVHLACSRGESLAHFPVPRSASWQRRIRRRPSAVQGLESAS